MFSNTFHWLYFSSKTAEKGVACGQPLYFETLLQWAACLESDPLKMIPDTEMIPRSEASKDVVKLLLTDTKATINLVNLHFISKKWISAFMLWVNSTLERYYLVR